MIAITLVINGPRGKSLHCEHAQYAAPLHWVVIVRFTKVDFPVQARQPIEANGGKCIAAWECAYGNNFVGVLLAEEPSGDSGELERHLSVSASTACIRRMPKRKEMRAALDAAGMSGEAQMQVGNNVIHLIRRGDDTGGYVASNCSPFFGVDYEGSE